jgi:hypothetical protein
MHGLFTVTEAVQNVADDRDVERSSNPGESFNIGGEGRCG